LLETPELVGKIYGDNDPCNGFANPPDEITYPEAGAFVKYLINR